MSHRQLCKKIPASWQNTDEGALLRHPFPTWDEPSVDPFVLIDEYIMSPPAGFPHHAHRGFEKITYVLQGQFQHADSLGHEGVVSAGDVQHLTAGSGIYHSEMSATDGSHALQLWVNLPHRLKDIDAAYQVATAAQLPTATFSGGRVVTLAGADSPIQLHTNVACYDIVIDEPCYYRLSAATGNTVLLYPLVGTGLLADGTSLVNDAIYVLGMEGDVAFSGDAGFRALIMAGLPQQEPIHVWGSFVD